MNQSINMISKIEDRIQSGHIQRSLSFIAAASGVLSAVEVSLEHYRGSYGQRVMYSPILLSLGLAGSGLVGTVKPKVARTWLPLASWALILDGVIGFGFHIRGIHRKPGGWRLPVANIVMGPPLFAPLLLTIGGFLGLIAAKLSPEETKNKSLENSKAELQSIRRWLQGATAVSALLNGFEALYSHYKTRFRVPAQWIPIVLTPPLVLAAMGAGLSKKKNNLGERTLPILSTLALLAGGVGFFYHLRATLRKPGLKDHPFYNLVYGPPPLAPLLFAATGFLGLLACGIGKESGEQR